jgi:hypothetical protein
MVFWQKLTKLLVVARVDCGAGVIASDKPCGPPTPYAGGWPLGLSDA